MKRTIKFIIIICVCLFFSPIRVLAAYSYDSEPVSMKSCKKAYRWCTSSSHSAVRLSLYKYIKGNNPVYYGSRDYKASGDWGSVNAYYVKNKAGKVAYQKGLKSYDWSDSAAKINVNSNVIGGDLYDSVSLKEMKSDVENLFSFSKKDQKKIKEAINNVFSKSFDEGDLKYLYVTIEPAYLVYKREKGYYYGTAYELLNLPGYASTTSPDGSGKVYTNSYIGIDALVFHEFLLSIVAGKPSEKDKNNFISEKNSALVQTLSNSKGKKQISLAYNYKQTLNSSTARASNKTKGISNDGFGISVFWPGDYVDFDCSTTCSGKSGNSLLYCAEKYCKNSTSKAQKASCITSCGYEKPDKENCPSAVLEETAPFNTTCKDNIVATKKTCKDSDTYFKTVCYEKTRIKHPNLSPNSLQLNQIKNFNYTISTNGIRNCTKTFNYKLFQYDYATQVSKDGRNDLLDKLDDSYFTNKDELKNFKYPDTESSWNTINFKNSTSPWTTFTLSDKKTTTEYKDSEKKSLQLYSNGDKSSKNVFVRKQYVSKSSAKLKISGIPYDTGSLGTKNVSSEIERSTSSLNSKNSCPYQIKNDESPDLSCSGVILTTPVDGKYNNDVEVKYVITYKDPTSMDGKGSNSDLKYYIETDNSKDDIEDSPTIVTYDVPDTFEITQTINKVEGATITQTLNVVSTDGKISTSCSVPLSFEDASKETCSIGITSTTTLGEIDGFKINTNAMIVTCTDAEGNEIELDDDLKFKFDEVLSEENPGRKVTCTATMEDLTTCEEKVGVGDCKYIPPAHLTSVKKYCQDFASYDVADFPDEDTCVTDCSETCHHLTEYEEIKTWCSENAEEQGYLNEFACINDCSDPEYGDYIFRPITLGTSKNNLGEIGYNAFPNRKAGGNWYGVEAKTEVDSFEGTPIYTINLTSQDIKKIKENTNGMAKDEAYTPYERLEKEKKKEQYESKFIREDFKQIFCIDGSGEGCDE